MRRCTAFGNNVCGNLDPSDGSSSIPVPKDVTVAVGCDAILWHSWSCTIGQASSGLRIWGIDPLVSGSGRINELSVKDAVKILGQDNPVAYLTRDGHVHTFAGKTSVDTWDDVAVCGLDQVYAVSAIKGLFRFESIDDLFCTNGSSLSHPLLGPSIRLYASETRCLVVADGPVSHLFEAEPGSLRLIEEVEGLGIAAVVAGPCNRFVIVTSAGEAYLFSKGGRAPELVEVEGGDAVVRFVALGSDFELVVTEENVWIRGNNDFGQLGFDTKTLDDFERHPSLSAASEIVQVIAGRWSCMITMEKS